MKLEAPRLPFGIIGLAEAAEIIGCSRQHAWRLAGQGKFPSLRQVGSKPLYVVTREDAERIRDSRTPEVADVSSVT